MAEEVVGYERFPVPDLDPECRAAPLRDVDRQHVILPEDRRCGRITVYTGIESAGVENNATKWIAEAVNATIDETR